MHVCMYVALHMHLCVHVCVHVCVHKCGRGPAISPGNSSKCHCLGCALGGDKTLETWVCTRLTPRGEAPIFDKCLAAACVDGQHSCAPRSRKLGSTAGGDTVGVTETHIQTQTASGEE